MEIKREKIDLSYNQFLIGLKFSILLFITNPIFYLFTTTFDMIYLFVDIFFVLIIIIIFNFLFFLIVYIVYKIKKNNPEIKFYSDFLEVRYEKNIKKIYYADIEIVIIKKNLLGSREILINYPKNDRTDNIFNNFRKDEKNSIVLSCVSNYREILSEMIKKIEFNQLEKNLKNLKYQYRVLSLFTVIYVVVLFVFFYKIKYSFILLFLIVIKRSKRYNYVENKKGIKILSNNEIIYLKEGNYIKEENKLILKLKNTDSLFQKKFFIIESDPKF